MSKEEIVFSGKIGQVVHIPQPSGKVFEIFKRPPGTRLIIVSPDNKILVTQEHRHETKGIDYRLPGGKVRDTLKEWKLLEDSNENLVDAARVAANKEALEETGIIAKDTKFITKAVAGATVTWDLYYFLITDYDESQNGQSLEDGEDIEVTWMSSNEIKDAIAGGQMQEWRSVGVLLGKVLPELEANI